MCQNLTGDPCFFWGLTVLNYSQTTLKVVLKRMASSSDKSKKKKGDAAQPNE